MEGFGWYTFEICKRLVEGHPEHDFVFFFDRPYDPKFIFSSNVTPVIVSPPARHPILFIYWFGIALKKAIKKYEIDVFFSPDGYLSLGSTVPQISVIHDINFEHYPMDLPFSARIYLRKYFPLFARKASKILTVSNYSKEDISKTYSIGHDKITVAWNGASEVFKPLSEIEKELTRKNFTQDKPYFIFVGAIHPRKNVKRMIEAFVQFKEKSKSTMQFVIVGESLWKNSTMNLTDSQRSDIQFTGHLALDELAKVMASAFALIYVPYFEGFGIPLLEAMQCGVPILAGNKTSLPEVAGKAAIYCDPFSVQDIADKMLELTESEFLRDELIANGLERSKLFSWDKASEIVWKEIESVSKKQL
jgi:glycosyltransferase involved in cell wall biosynthesis